MYQKELYYIDYFIKYDIIIYDMKIIAFDLEACNRYVKGSVFSIGVVESNDEFEMIRSYTILINPETKFVTKFRKPIEFGITSKDLKEERTFPEMYIDLKKLFSEDAIFIAHSVNNDIRMLADMCKRYGKKSFSFKYICSQAIYSIYENVENGIALNAAAEIIGHDLNHHDAEEDAIMCIKLLDFVCKQEKCNFYELMEKYGIKYGYYKNYENHNMVSKSLIQQREVRKKQRVKEKEIKAEVVENN